MNCDRCPHMKRIRAALAPCQSCEAGQLHGQVHVDGWSMDKALASRVISDNTPSSGVTHLAPEDEEVLCRTFAALFGQPPEHLLMIQYYMMHPDDATGSGFRAHLRRVERKIHRYKDASSRAMSHAMRQTICKALPAMRPIFDHAIDPRVRSNAEGVR